MTYRAWNTKTVDRAALKELTAAIAQQNTEELEYQNMDEEWSEEKYRSVLAAQQKEAGLLAGILAARGITDPAEALTLLAGEEELSDPMLLTDMDKACERILRAIDEGETIVVFGDYDVDGVTATALLYQHLKGMGAAVKCMLPSREGDGYGLSKNAIQSPSTNLWPLSSKVLASSSIFTSLSLPQPETQQVPIPRATTAAWLVMPPRTVRMP